VTIKSATIEFYDNVSNGTTPGTLSILDDNDVQTDFTGGKNLTGGNIKTLDYLYSGKPTRSLSVQYVSSSGAYGIRRIIIRSEGTGE
jgi:hypothetical protein